MTSLVVRGTPWEAYDMMGMTVHVKREDLSCPPPGPSFSKIRGVEWFLRKQKPGTPIGVLDTFHSKAGWGVAYICAAMGLPCYDYYPVYKREGNLSNHELRHNQQKCKEFGAHLRPLQAGMSAILFHYARKQLAEETGGKGIMMPNGLKLDETVEATAWEVEEYTPDELFAGTWLVSISSGTICAGVIRGLQCEDVHIIAHMGYSRSESKARDYMLSKAGCEFDMLDIVDEGFAYKDFVGGQAPFPCNRYYDLKAWRWLVGNAYMHGHLHELEPPVVFWNIGA